MSNNNNTNNKSAAFLKWTSLILLLFQNAATPIFFRYAMTENAQAERFDSVVAVVLQEFMKLIMSLMLLFGEERFSWRRWIGVIRNQIWRKPMDTLKLAIPAILYFVQNVLLQKASGNLPAAVFQVSYQGKTLVVALCSVLLLQKELNRAKWLAVCLMAGGLAIIQLFKGGESKQEDMANAEEQNIVLGMIYVVCGCFCSGFAGVYFEKMMKFAGNSEKEPGAPKPSMWVRNIQLAAFSTMIGGLHLMVTLGPKYFSSSSSAVAEGAVVLPDEDVVLPLLHGFSPKVWFMVFNNAFGGLCVAFVIMCADNILKGFACALATVLTTIVSVPLFGFSITLGFWVGMLTVVGSTLLYGGTLKIPGVWWTEEPETCRRLRNGGAHSGGADKKYELVNQTEHDESSVGSRSSSPSDSLTHRMEEGTSRS